MFGISTRCRWLLGIAMGGAIALSTNSASAQITPDKTLPNNSSVTREGNTFNINGGTQAGRNLFHSFGEFSLPTGGTAYFNNTADIQNIFSRVTGRSVSSIDGLIRANGTANLFLINPNGIIFGKNASLDIGGSFVGSTASSLKFADGTEFSATAPQTTPLLTISVPIGLQFGTNPASILNSSQTPTSNFSSGLQPQVGKTLALVGGDISLNGGSLTLAGGRVELGGVAGAGVVGLLFDGDLLRLSFPNDVALANINLTNGAQVNVTSGNVNIRSRLFSMTGGSFLNIDTNEQGATANLSLSILVDNSVALDNSDIFSGVQSRAVGKGSDINITTGSLSLTNGARLVTSVHQAFNNKQAGRGDAGNININARDRVALDGESSDGRSSSGLFSSVEPRSVGRGGSINLTTGSLSVTNGAQVSASTFGQGDAGDVNINVREHVALDGTSSDSTFSSGAFSRVQATAVGRGGSVNLTAGSLSVTNGAQLSASTFGRGDAGSLNVNVLDSVDLIGTSFGRLPSGLRSAVERGAVGNGGDITFATSRLLVRDGAQVSTATFGAGDAGNLTVLARDSVELIGTSANGQFASGLTSAVEQGSVGNGGNLNFTTNSLMVRDGAEVTVRNQGAGNAGNLTATAQSIRLDNQGKLTANSVAGEGGNISLRVQDLLLMRRGSQISNTSGIASAGGNGGNFTANVGFIVAVPSENSDIITNAFTGQGGNIRIVADGSIIGTEFRESLTPQSDIVASGSVVLVAPNLVDPSFGLINLPTTPVDTKVAQGCYAGGSQSQSEFMITGRGGLPPNPGETLSTDAVEVELVTLPSQEAQRQQSRGANQEQSHTADYSHKVRSVNPPTQIVEAQGWVVDKNGDVFLVAQAPTATPHSPLFTPASCEPERE